MFDFPNSPVVGQVFKPTNGPIWEWDGVAWTNVIEGQFGPTMIDRIYLANATWTRPTGVILLEVTVQAGGGAGCSVIGVASNSNEGCGGAGGGCATKTYQTSAIPASVSLTVGAGGAVAAGNTLGGAGGNSIFDTITANGGAGGSYVGAGTAAQVWTGSQGGIATGGDINIRGGNGSPGIRATGINGVAGHGGSSLWDGGGYGGGGGSNAVGGNGSNGSGGAGGIAFTAATVNGGAGGAGFIRVREHYGRLGAPIIASKRTVITASTSTFQFDALTLYADIEVTGGGGAGAGAGTSGAAGTAIACGGGAGGGYAKKLIQITDAVRAATKTIVVGAGGVGTNASGPAGGNSSYTDGINTLTGSGGSGGNLAGPNTASVASGSSAGGTGSGGDINASGQYGHNGISQGSAVGQTASSSMSWGGMGGPSGNGSPGGVGARVNSSSSLNSFAGGNAPNYGGGGGGACGANAYASYQNGGNGGQGVVIITEYSGAPPVAAAVIADAPSDGNEYVRVNGLWRLKRQTFNPVPSGVNITVPAGAVLARITGKIHQATTTATSAVVRFSADGSTFLAGSIYTVAGTNWYTGSATSPAKQAAAAGTGLTLAPQSDNINLPHQFDAVLSCSRPASSTAFFAMQWRGWSYNSSATLLAQGYDWVGYSNDAAFGSLTQLPAFQIIPLGGGTFAAPSYISVEWLY